MTVAAISLLSVPKSVGADGPGAGAVAPDGPAGFAATMAGAGHPGASRGVATQDAKDAKGGKDVIGTQDAKDASDAKDRNADQRDLDKVRDTDRDQHDDQAQDGSTTSTMALFGIVMPPIVRNDDHGETADGAQSAGLAGNEASAVSTAIASRPPLGSDPAGDGKTDTLSAKDSDAAALAPMLAALTDTLAKGAAARRAETAEAATAKVSIAVPPRGADGQQIPPAKWPGAAPLDTDVTATPPANPTRSSLSPVGAAVTSIEKTDAALPTSSSSPATAPLPAVAPLPAAAPLPATATLMAARAATTTPDVANIEARKPAGNVHTGSDGNQDADALAYASATPATAAPVAAPLTATGDRIAPASAPVIDGAGQELAAATADRQLDLARQGAWLDGIAHDISAAGASTGAVRFEVAPQHLGTVAVELKRDDNGTAVTLTTGSEAARSILTDASPQLLAEARAHGLHIASAQVDVGSGKAGSNGNPSPDSQWRPSGGQPDGRHAASQNSGFSAQAGMGSDTGRQSQTRSQPLPEYRSGTTRTDRGSVGETKASAAAASNRSPDARYA